MNGPKLSIAGLLMTSIFATGGCNINIEIGETLVGSDVAVTEARETDSFSKIEVGGAIKVDASVGETLSVSVSGDDNIVPIVTTEVVGDTLEIRTEHNGSLNPKQPLVVTIVSPELDGTSVSGACNVKVRGLTGAGFEVELSGASTLTLEGECQQLTADVSGASTLNAKSLRATTASVQVSGASNANLYATDSITGNASGASSVRYSGAPNNASIDTSGASSVKSE